MGCAGKSAGLADGTGAGKEPAERFAEQILKLDGQPARAESILHKKCMEIPCAENILETNGAGGNILAGILAETGDASRFDDVKEIQKLSGTGLASCSCGRHKGQVKISRRGRRRLRYLLFQAAKPAVLHADGFGQLHVYYTARAGNPLKKMQPLTVTACKVLRVINTILKTGTAYDPQKMLKDTKRPEAAQEQPAA